MHHPFCHLRFCSRAFAQIKRYQPSQDALGEAKASEVLLENVKAILHEFGLRPSDLASGTTDSGSEVKSSNFKAKFDDLQVDVLGEVLKIPDQAPQRWLTLVRTLERVVRLWRVLRKLYSDTGKTFPLEEGDDKDCILQLYSLLQPFPSVTRDGQYGGAPMLADIYMKFGMLKMRVLHPSEELKVFDVPPLGEDGLPEEQKKALPQKMVAHDDLHPVAQKARNKLCRALVTRFYGRVWDTSTLDPSVLCDAACLLTPPFSEGNYLSAMKLTAEGCEYLPTGSCVTAPTPDEEVQKKLDGAWAEIKKRAVAAVKTAQSRAAGGGEGGGKRPLKRARTSAAGSSRRKNREDAFASFGRNEVDPQSREGDVDLVEKEVSSEIMRYKGVFM
ncbi:unnamed protein product [Ectocarpus sp. CCAP 1310/34]|nr:unnamed protein product [Ectocarpus sp. CCAP 1310/34]